MKLRQLPLVTALIVLAVSLPGLSAAQSSGSTDAPLSAERQALYDAFASRWADYVQDTYHIDAQVWRQRVAVEFVGADLDNLRQALGRATFEAAMATVNGRGHRIPDEATDARDTIALGRDAADVLAKLGDLGADMVYTPVAPCRIVDTRSTPAGAIAAASTRSFVGAGALSYASQGGSATNCGLSQVSPGAIAINVTAVTPSGGGFATVFPFSAAQPATASLNYTAGAVVNNTVITKVPDPVGSFDFTVYTFAQSHFVIDIVGYFDSPEATPIACVNSSTTDLVLAAGATGSSQAAATCPAGYGSAALTCESTSFDMPLVMQSGDTCSARNNGGSPATLKAGWRCCRVPGR